MSPKKKSKLKRTIKFLSHCHDPKIISKVISNSPNNVTKAICNAAINAAQGDVHLNRKQKKLLASHRAFVSAIIKPGEPLSQKKRLLIQKGGGIIGLVVPAILSAVLGSIGSSLFH